MEMIEQLVSRTDAAYERWLAAVTDDVAAAAGVVVYCRESLLERNAAYGVGEWLAGYLMIGQEGDGDSSSGATAAARCSGPTWAVSAKLTSRLLLPRSRCGCAPVSLCRPIRCRTCR